MFRLLAENVLDYAVFIVDPHRHILSWSKGAERLLGFTEQEIVGRKCDLFFTPADVAAGVPQKELDEALATGRGDDDRWHQRKDGSRFWASGVVTPLRDGGTLRGFAKIMRDRTDLKRGQDELADALAYAEAIVATVREPLVVLDGDLRVRTASRSFYQAFRVEPEQTEGRLLYDLGNRQWDIPALRTLLGEVLPRNAAFDDFEVEHDFPGVGRKVVLLNGRKLNREGNTPELILLAIEDVTAVREAERARREAETRFTEMVKNVRDHSIFLTDLDGVITSWNVAAERIIGYSEADAVGKPFSLIFTPDDIAAGVPGEELRRAREEGRAEDERWHRRKDGSLFWALGVVTPLHDARGGLSGYSKVLRDMTAWKRADEERRRSAFLVENATDFIGMCDLDGRPFYVNPAGLRMVGLDDLDHARRTPVVEFFFPEDRAFVEGEFLPRVLRDGRGEVEVRIRHFRTGEAVWVVYAVTVLRDDAGRPTGLATISRNVTDSKWAEQHLAASRARLQAVFDTTQDAILLAGDDARYTDANPAACTLLGRDRDELLGLGVFDITPTTNGEAGRAAWAAFVRDGRQEGEYEVRRKDGSTAVVEYRAVANVQPGLHLSALRDVSERRRGEEALRASEQRFRTLATHAPVGIFQTDPAGNCVFVNDRWCGITGLSAAEAAGDGWVRALHPDDRDRIRGEWYAAAAAGREFAADYRFVAPDGRTAWVRGTAVALRDDAGAVTGHLGTVADITEPRAAAEALRESEERLRTALAAARMVAWEWTPADGRLRVSENAADVFGLPAGVGLTGIDQGLALVHPEDVAAYRATFQKAIDDRDGYLTRYRLVRPADGRVIWIEERGNTVFDQPGGAVRLFGVAADVTARKHVEAELARVTVESERRKRLYETILANTPDLAYVFDLNHRFTCANEGLLRMWGMTWDVAIGRNCLELGYEPWHAEMHDREIEEVKATKKPIRGEVPFAGTFGRRIYDYIFVPVLGPTGEVEAVAGTTRDVTERKQMEDELRRTAAELSEANRRKDEFLATLAHELRNPLAPLRNGLQVLRLAGGDAAAVERSLGMMERQLGHLVHLIDDLLDVSRISRGKIALKKERVDLAAIVQAAVEGSRPQIDAAGHQLTVAMPPAQVYLDADPARLAQVFANLLTNAAKYTDRAGRISLTAQRQGGEVAVAVRDTGIGIAAEHLPRLFEMFSQVSSALERSQGGLGIGLALVKGLVEMHGGTVEARSEGLGAGSEFVVRLPVAGTAARETATPVGGGEVSRPPGRRILVADDNRDAADSLAEMLRLFGHEVHTAHDGVSAVEAVGRVRPDVAILDIGMPGLNGYAACRRIREQPWGRAMTLVALTGWGQEEDRRRAAEAGFDHHLTKPVDPAALEGLLAALPPRTA
jgi:PAS domain S-box-containing protein